MMIQNYMKTAMRSLSRQKAYSMINISGLAVGMACVILIGLYIQDELSYDRYHTHADRIYRLTACRTEASFPSFVGTPPPLGPTLKRQFPEVQDFVRFDPFMGKSKSLFRYGDKTFYEDRFFLADPSIFDVFDFGLLRGDPATALSRPNYLVISQSTADKYFGDEDPIGKTLNFDGELDFTVTGVMEDIPSNSHFFFDLVASFAFINDIKRWDMDLLQSWRHFNFYTYLFLKEGVDSQAFVTKATRFIQELFQNAEQKLYIEPMTEIHLRTKITRDPEPHGDIMNVVLYATIAAIVLLIACINFMNLYTANAEVRAKEVGVRKVVGAHRKQLAFQILGESMLLSFIALPAAVLLAHLAMPLFNRFTGKSLQLLFSHWTLLAGLGAMTFFVGILSGFYPSLFIASFQPIKIIQGRSVSSRGGLRFRHVLVVLQFTLSIMFIIGSFFIRNQMRYVMNKDLGYDRENIINVPMYSPEARLRYEAFKEAVGRHSDIIDVTATSFTPSIERWREGLYFEGRTDEDDHMFYRIACDYNFIDMFGLELIAGRTFVREIASDLETAWILNESAVREIGWNPEDAIDKSFGTREGQVIGIVKDFHFRSLRRETRPLVINVFPRAFQYASIRVKPDALTHTVGIIEARWGEINPGYPFEYTFYDDEFDKLYQPERKLQTVLEYFTFLAIFVACLGLFGLSLFTVQRRTKEIGIRKVLGARFAQVSLVLTMDILKLVLLSVVVAVPFAFLAVQRWLQGFTYRIGIGVLPFVVSGLLACAISLFTVSFQVIRVARTNPTDVLKYE